MTSEEQLYLPTAEGPLIQNGRSTNVTNDLHTTPDESHPRPTSTGNVEATEGGTAKGWRFYLIFAALAIACLAAALDSTAITVMLPTITHDLGGTGIEAFWAGTSYLLTSTVVQPTFASLSHIFGRKPLLLISLAIFMIGSIVSATPHRFNALLIGRSLQGFGAGGAVVVADIVVTDLVELRLRGKWFGYLSIMYVVGTLSGPVIGGAFSEKDLWRWIFWINLPLGAISVVLIVVFLHLHLDRSTVVQKLKRVDWWGTFIFVASATSTLMGLSWGGVLYSWSSWRTLLPLLIGIAGFGLVVFWELRVAVEPSIRLAMFHKLTAKITFFITFLHGLILYLQLYYLPLYFEAVKGYSAVIAGVALFPETMTVAPMALIAGILISNTSRYKWLVWIGWMFSTLGMGLMYLLDVHTSVPAWIFINLTSGPGVGILYSAMAFAVQASVNNEDVAFAVAAYSFFRSFGSAFGVAIGGVIFQNEIKRKLLTYPLLAPFAEQYSKDSPTLVSVIKGLSDQPVMQAQLRQAFADALKPIWLLGCGVSGLSLLLSFVIKDYSLDVVLETQQGMRKEKEKDVNLERLLSSSTSRPSTLDPPHDAPI